MSKFCGNCGAELERDAQVCGKCGTPVDGKPNKSKGIKPIKESEPTKFKKAKRKMKLIIALVIVCILALTAYKVVTNFTGNKGLLRKVMTAYENYDIGTLVSLSSVVYHYSTEEALRQYLEDAVGIDLDMFENTVGHSYKLSYEINEIYTLSERRQNEILNTLEYTYPDCNIDFFEKFVVADITVTAKQDAKLSTQDIEITMTKENNSWKLLYIK